MKGIIVQIENENQIGNLKENFLITKRSYKLKILVDALRLVADDNDINDSPMYIPDNCEKYGFVEGYHNLGTLFHFLADMIEE